MRARKEWLEWFRVDRDLPEHEKLYELADRGGWGTDKALGRLIRLWAWIAKHAADGNLGEAALVGLSRHMVDSEQANNHLTDLASGNDGTCPCCDEPTATDEAIKMGGKSLAPFFDAGFLQRNGSGYIVHDWASMNGYALKERERDRDRKSLGKNNSGGSPMEFRGNSGGSRTDSHRNGDGDVTDTETEESGSKSKAQTYSANAERVPPSAIASDPGVNGNGGGADKAEASIRDWMEAFPEFWKDYPRKVARTAAMRAYAKVKPRTQETCDLIFAGLDHYQRTVWPDRPADKIEHAATWLNQRRFDDATEKP